MSLSSTTAPATAPDLRWLLVNSLWLAAPVFSAGLLTGPVLLLLGRRSGLTLFLWLGGVYSAAAVIGYLMSPEAGPIMGTLVWIMGSLHCLALNSQWLRNRWQARTGVESATGGSEGSGRTGAAPTSGSSRTGVGGVAADLLSDPLLQPDAYLAGTADAGGAADSAGSGAGSAAVLDVNAAPRVELLRLPGIGSKRAGRVLAGRRDRRFSSLQDFAERVGLGERALERLRGRISFGPGTGSAGTGNAGTGSAGSEAGSPGPGGARRPAPGFGRRVDY